MTPSDDNPDSSAQNDTDYCPFGTSDDSGGSDDTSSATTDNPWDWGTLKTPDGEIIPPGACDGYHNKPLQRDTFK